MAMRETKIRFGERAWKIIQEEAILDGVSASQFVRESALARAVYLRSLRGEALGGNGLQDIIRQLREEA